MQKSKPQTKNQKLFPAFSSLSFSIFAFWYVILIFGL
jgi:hypothetical protein